MSSVKERFLRYVQVETTSCEENECCPSTPGQKVLGEMLVSEMQALGMQDAVSFPQREPQTDPPSD